MQSLPGHPYDGHTMEGALEQVMRITGSEQERCFVNRGYRGHGVTNAQVFISEQRRGVTLTIKKELRCRSAVEAVIGYEKTEGRLDRYFLCGEFSNKAKALMAGIGYNLRAILRKLRLLLPCSWHGWKGCQTAFLRLCSQQWRCDGLKTGFCAIN